MSFVQSVRLWARGSKWKKMVLAAALPAWLALGATQALAVPAAGGNDTNANIGVGACTTLNFQPITVVGNQVRYCAATGSADVLNPGQNGGLYAFNLTLDNVVCAPLDGGKERTVQFSNLVVAGTPVPDNRIKEVTSTGFFKVSGAGVHMIRWTARPIPGSPATIVLDRSLSVVCTDVPLPD
jgi:hypothetical protein